MSVFSSFRKINAKILTRMEKNRILITGANQGIGLATAIKLARKGYCDITIACRNEDRARSAVQTILDVTSNDILIQYVLVDFAHLQSVHNLIADFKTNEIYFDIVVLNAGVLLPEEVETVDGIDTTFQVNFLAQWLLVREIIAFQCPMRPLHIVTLTSVLHRLYPVFQINATRMSAMFNCRKSPWKAYIVSKWATALLATGLNRLPGVSAVAINPGVVRTHMTEIMAPINKHRSNTNESSKIYAKLSAICSGLREGIVARIMLTPDAAAENVLFCIENPKAFCQYEYRNVNCTKKLGRSVLCTSNWAAMKRLADQLIAESS